MRILYISIHEILEYDEVRLLTGLGHQVFPLGYHHLRMPIGGMRPLVELGPEHAAWQDRFEAAGCRYDVFDPIDGTVLTREFVAQFDLTIVMMNAHFAHRFAEALSVRPVVLRTIGQGLDAWEPLYAGLRSWGVRILRYAEAEASLPDFIGADATIRFYKDPADFKPWRGDNPRALSFAAAFAQRYPAQFALWREATEGLPMLLAGPGNTGGIGAVSAAEQLELLAGCRAYFYCSGLELPYTLNFIEAWMAGVPLVVMDDALVPRPHRINEIARLIRPGHDALLARSTAEARILLQGLIAEPATGGRIGAAGRQAAIAHFGRALIAEQWRGFLQGIAQHG
jgi:hypothetical protein